ncbi:putative serine racemase, Ammonia-lyase [Helianthus annuus]|nr:putative serine racemase, Ammonia-lyase [Helianthus annuus]
MLSFYFYFFIFSCNHAATQALAAKLQRIPAYIVIANVKCYGGRIIFNEATIKSRQETKKVT